MDSQELMEKTILKDVLGSFIRSYAERDKSVEFSDWLEDRLRQEIPDMPKEAGQRLAEEIIEAVAGYDNTLGELNAAVDAGQSKEEWFAQQLAETYDSMPLDAVGEKLRQIENTVLASNVQLMQEISGTQINGVEIIDAVAEPVDWNEYSIRDKVYEIGKQVALTGVAAAANILKEQAESSGNADLSGAVAETFQEGLKKDTGEVKAVVAGAVRVAAEKGLEKLVPEGTSTDMICDLAGVAVESAEAIFDVASGGSTMTEALDKIGRASIAAGGRMAGQWIEGKLVAIPVVGSVLVDLAGGLIEHVSSEKFADNVYTTFHDAAVATWEGIKKSRIGRIVGKVKNMVFG